MERKREVMRQCISLVEIIQEGLAHVQQQIKEGRFESTISLFKDIVYAYERVETSIIGLEDDILSEKAKTLQAQIIKGLDATVQSYEISAYGKVNEVLQFTLIPSFRKWHDQLDMDFGKYLVN